MSREQLAVSGQQSVGKDVINNIFMEDIKVRVWNGSKMTYLPDMNTSFRSNDKIMPCAPWADENGKDVYAGDIMETRFKDEMEATGEAVVRTLIGFTGAGFAWYDDVVKEWFPLESVDVVFAKVVGNVIENPELMEQS